MAFENLSYSGVQYNPQIDWDGIYQRELKSGSPVANFLENASKTVGQAAEGLGQRIAWQQAMKDYYGSASNNVQPLTQKDWDELVAKYAYMRAPQVTQTTPAFYPFSNFNY